VWLWHTWTIGKKVCPVCDLIPIIHEFVCDLTYSHCQTVHVCHSHTMWRVRVWLDEFVCDVTHPLIKQFMWDMTHSHDPIVPVRRDAIPLSTTSRVTWLIPIINEFTRDQISSHYPTVHGDMAHSHYSIVHVWRDSFIYVTWLIYIRDICLIHMCDMTHSCVWHDLFICVTWLIHMCDSTHSYVWHESFKWTTWPIHMCDMTHSYVWLFLFLYVTRLIHVWHDSFICVTWLIHMCDMTHSYVW